MGEKRRLFGCASRQDNSGRQQKGCFRAHAVHVRKQQRRGDYSSEWMTTPERNFGSNQVALGGMMLPVSAMRITCSMETG